VQDDVQSLEWMAMLRRFALGRVATCWSPNYFTVHLGGQDTLKHVYPFYFFGWSRARVRGVCRCVGRALSRVGGHGRLLKFHGTVQSSKMVGQSAFALIPWSNILCCMDIFVAFT
jgi:hypothetical protein